MLDNKTYKVKRTKAQQLVLGFETDLGGLIGLMTVLSSYHTAGVAGLQDGRTLGWMLAKLRFLRSVATKGNLDLYGFLEGYEPFTFIYWKDVKDCLVVREDVDTSPTINTSVFNIKRYTNKPITVSLDSKEARVVKDALSYGILDKDFNNKINNRVYLIDLINDLVEVYKGLKGLALADIFEVDLSMGITEGLSKGLNRVFVEDLAREGTFEGLNKEGVALHIEKTPEGILEIEGFKLVGFYSFFK